MDPDRVKFEKTLSPFRKKTADFKTLWYDADGVTPKKEMKDVWDSIRSSLAKHATLTHMDFGKAANPEKSGCPLEMFIDANDYGWAACLTQRLEPHAVSKIVLLISRSFSDTQLRWSAMEREFYDIWQGVVGHERLIKGFKCY